MGLVLLGVFLILDSFGRVWAGVTSDAGLIVTGGLVLAVIELAAGVMILLDRYRFPLERR